MDVKDIKILQLIKKYGSIDGAHHKQWVLDQIVRIITVDDYGYEKKIMLAEKGIFL